MWWLGWAWLDPAVALLIGAVVAWSAFGLLRESLAATMDAVPRGIDPVQVRAFLAAQPGVDAVHHVHIWSLGAGEIALTAHVVRHCDTGHDAFIAQTVGELGQRFRITHPTLQVEHGDGCRDATAH